MALVSKGVFISIVLADAAGNKSTLNLNLKYANLTALSDGIANGDINGLLADLAAVTTAQIVGYTYGERFAEDTDFFGAAGSEVENQALIVAKIDGKPNKSTTLRIPAPDDGAFVGTTGENRNIIDTSAAIVQNWLDNFAASGADLATVSDGESLADPTVAGNFKGKRIHRASRSG